MKKLTKAKVFIFAFLIFFIGIGSYSLYSHVLADTFTLPTVENIAYETDLTLSDVEIPQNNDDGTWSWADPTISLISVTCGVVNTFDAEFTITDLADYDLYSSELGYEDGVITRSLSFTVSKADLVANEDYTIPSDLSCTYGADNTLNDVALPEGFAWTTPSTVPECDEVSFPGTFTPDDINHYNVANIQIPLDVNKAELSIDDINLPVFSGTNEYNAAKTLASYTIPSNTSEYGTFAWSNATIVPTVNEDEYDIVFTASEQALVNYDFTQITDWNETNNTLAMTCTLTIVKKNVTTFASPTVGAVEYTDELTLSDVSLPEGWTWSDEDANTELNAGSQDFDCEYEVDDDNYDYSAVSGYADGIVTRQVTVVVNRAIPVVTTPTCAAITYDPDTTLADSDLPEGWEWTDADTVPTVDVNTYEASFEVTDNTNYNYDSVSGYNNSTTDPKVVRNVTLQVNQATPEYEVPTIDAIAFEDGKTLADYPIEDENWAWKTSTTVLTMGTHAYAALYTPEDIVNYKTVEEMITVYAYEDREELVPDVSDAVISGLTEGENYDVGTKFSISVNGAGMDNESPIPGDVRYVPISWSVNPNGTWTSAPYTATFTLSKSGDYTFTVTYREESFDENTLVWTATGETDTTETIFSVGTEEDEDEDSENEVVSKKKNTTGSNSKKNNSSIAPKTGDQTPIELLIIIAAVALCGIICVLIFTNRKKKNA